MLVSLDLSLCQMCDQRLSQLRQLPKLHALSLQGCETVTDVGIAHLQYLTGLTLLDLQNCCKVGHGILRHCIKRQGYPKLTCPLPCSQGPHKSPELQCLILCVQITDRGIQSVTRLTALQSLDVSGCVALTQRGFQHIASSLSALRSLKLGGCSRMATVTDACLSPVSSLTALTSLDMAGCIEVTDSGHYFCA